MLDPMEENDGVLQQGRDSVDCQMSVREGDWGGRDARRADLGGEPLPRPSCTTQQKGKRASEGADD